MTFMIVVSEADLEMSRPRTTTTLLVVVRGAMRSLLCCCSLVQALRPLRVLNSKSVVCRLPICSILPHRSGKVIHVQTGKGEVKTRSISPTAFLIHCFRFSPQSEKVDIDTMHCSHSGCSSGADARRLAVFFGVRLKY
jgi:hypothetical protein